MVVHVDRSAVVGMKRYDVVGKKDLQREESAVERQILKLLSPLSSPLTLLPPTLAGYQMNDALWSSQRCGVPRLFL
jgi:hypothetical protein